MWSNYQVLSSSWNYDRQLIHGHAVVITINCYKYWTLVHCSHLSLISPFPVCKYSLISHPDTSYPDTSYPDTSYPDTSYLETSYEYLSALELLWVYERLSAVELICNTRIRRGHVVSSSAHQWVTTISTHPFTWCLQLVSYPDPTYVTAAGGLHHRYIPYIGTERSGDVIHS